MTTLCHTHGNLGTFSGFAHLRRPAQKIRWLHKKTPAPDILMSTGLLYYPRQAGDVKGGPASEQLTSLKKLATTNNTPHTETFVFKRTIRRQWGLLCWEPQTQVELQAIPEFVGLQPLAKPHQPLGFSPPSSAEPDANAVRLIWQSAPILPRQSCQESAFPTYFYAARRLAAAEQPGC